MTDTFSLHEIRGALHRVDDRDASSHLSKGLAPLDSSYRPAGLGVHLAFFGGGTLAVIAAVLLWGWLT